MPLLQVREGEEQGDLEGDEGEEEEIKGLRNYAALYFCTVPHSCLLVEPFAH